jgi:serine/threonine protein kinase
MYIHPKPRDEKLRCKQDVFMPSRYAVKSFDPHRESAAKDFEREVGMLIRFQRHPHIIQLISTFEREAAYIA